MAVSPYDFIGTVPGYLTTTNAGTRACVSSETIRRWMREGRLRGVRVNHGTVLVSEADLERLIAQREGR